MHRSTLVLALVGLAAAALPATATAQGGLSVSPSVVEATASKGATVRTTITNTSGAKLRVRVAARPWKQARDGTVTANRGRTLRGARVNGARFTLSPNASRDVSVTLTRMPAKGSLFGALDVVGKRAKRSTGIDVAYRLVSSMRFNPAPSARRYRLRAGGTRASGGMLTLDVRNAGNTVDPVGGRVSISGAGGGRTSTITAVRILPGKRIAVRAASLNGLRRGTYTARITLTQGGATRATVTRSFRVGG